jgi:hypothetical protein
MRCRMMPSLQAIRARAAEFGLPAVVVEGPQGGCMGTNHPAGFYAAEDHFRMRTVQTHGGLADLTCVLLITALL